MAKLMKKLTFFITAFLLSACQTTPPEGLPSATPEEVPSAAPVYMGTPVVGGIEPAYIIPFKKDIFIIFISFFMIFLKKLLKMPQKS